jgi:phosphoribosyl 1,2-cyclic phosphodiesterase
VAVHLTILGSGSNGNCAYVETAETRILVDAGFSLRQIRQLWEKLRIPVYCNRPTHEAAEYQLKTKFDCRIFTTGASFEIGDILVETFSIPHDAQDPVGFLLRANGANIGFLTDLGHATKLVLERVRPAHALVLESNHDVKMLQDCPRRPWSLKQRILGRHGHLSNEAAADAAEQIMSAELKHLYLGHLSRECNKPELAQRVMSGCLQKIGATHVRLELTAQNVPCPTLSL